MPRGHNNKIKYRLSDECERTWSRADKYKWRQRLCAMEEKLKHPERVRARTRKSSAKVKLEVLTHYGPGGKLQCCWEGCGETDIDMLTLDHINNDGSSAPRRAVTWIRLHTSSGMYFKTRKEGFPEGLQTLCANHQLKKEILRRRSQMVGLVAQAGFISSANSSTKEG